MKALLGRKAEQSRSVQETALLCLEKICAAKKYGKKMEKKI